MAITAGIDIGTGVIKAVVFEVNGESNAWLARSSKRIRQRNPYQLAEQMYDELLQQLQITRSDVAYVATTGEGESLDFHTGHFYSMTARSRRHLLRAGSARGPGYRRSARPGYQD